MLEKTNPLKGNFAQHTNKNADQTSRTTETARNWSPQKKPTDKASSFFGIERGTKFIRRFKLYLRDGSVMSVPYATLPLIRYTPSECLRISTSEITIEIFGRGLSTLTDWFSEEKVLWIKESGSGIDPEDEAVFLERIVVKEADDP